MKVLALALASATLVQGATAGSLVGKVPVQEARGFESFLPPVSPSLPWLNLDAKTWLPKGNYPIGRNAEVTPFVLRAPHTERVDFAAFDLGGG